MLTMPEVKHTPGITCANTCSCATPCPSQSFRLYFIPVRDMQYMVILEHDEIIFVASLALTDALTCTYILCITLK